MEKQETIAGYFVRESASYGDYCRPWGAIMRSAGGVCIRSSNDGAGNGSLSHSPTEEWKFPDGSYLEVGFSACREFSLSDDSEEN